MKHTTRITIATVVASLAIAGSAAAQKTKPETQAQLMRQAKISKTVATKTALAQVPGGKVKSSEIERENGKLIYSFDIKTSKPGVTEVNVDAITGKIVSSNQETPAKEAAEKKQEAKEKH